MPLQRGKGDFKIYCYPGAFVLKDPSFLVDTRGQLKEMFVNNASFPIHTNQLGGVELARCFSAIKVMDRHPILMLIVSNNFTGWLESVIF